jgi:hypothetical protein
VTISYSPTSIFIAGETKLAFIYDNKPTLTSIFSSNDVILATDPKSNVTLWGVNNDIIVDFAHGLHLSLLGVQNTTVYGWNSTDSIFMMRDGIMPTLKTDGHGGTLLTGGGSNVDFVAAHVTPSQISLA